MSTRIEDRTETPAEAEKPREVWVLEGISSADEVGSVTATMGVYQSATEAKEALRAVVPDALWAAITWQWLVPEELLDGSLVGGRMHQCEEHGDHVDGPQVLVTFTILRVEPGAIIWRKEMLEDLVPGCWQFVEHGKEKG